MEIDNIQIDLREPLPLLMTWLCAQVPLINCRFQLKIICLKVDHDIQSHGLLVLVLRHDVLGYEVLRGQDTCRCPYILFDVVIEALLLFIATTNQNIRNHALLHLGQHPWPYQRLWKCCNLPYLRLRALLTISISIGS